MTNEMIKNALEKKINATEMNDFYIDQIVYKQNACGCININNMWFIYKKMDEYCYLSLSGPFFENEIIKTSFIKGDALIMFKNGARID